MTKMVRGLDHFIRMGVTTSNTPTGVQAQTSPGHHLLHCQLGKPYAPRTRGIPTVRKGDGTEGIR
jgi:hypothetical protein